MSRVSLTRLEGLRERTERKPSPDDRFTLTVDRVARDWLVIELGDRRARLLQALSAPDIKETKREKYQRLAYGLSAALDSLVQAEIEPLAKRER